MDRLPDPLEWLAAGIPLTLLIDCLDPNGPASAAILDRERDLGPRPAVRRTTTAVRVLTSR